MKKIRIKFLIVFFILLFSSYNTFSKENYFGTAEARVKLIDGQWLKSGLNDIVLKVNEPFFVKVNISTKIDCTVSFEIYSPGKTVTYRVLSGPSAYHETIVKYNCPIGWSENFEWIICPTNNWTDGYAALNLRIQFSRWNKTIKWDENEQLQIGLINAFISSENWNGTINLESTNISSNIHQIPNYKIIIFLITLILIIILKKYWLI